MLRRGDRILCGLSGGADSVFLVCALHSLAEERGLSLRAVHVHHGIRGEAADGDAAFSEALCRALAIPFRLYRRDIPAESGRRGVSLEEAGRDARREILLMEAERWLLEAEAAGEGGGPVKIALAHHQGDLAESVLFRMARGTGIEGLGAIRPVAPLKGPIHIIRPLLLLKKREIQEALTRAGISWREDATNGEDDAARNRIRHHILPVLEAEINSAAADHIAALAQQAAETADFLRQEAKARYALYVREEEAAPYVIWEEKPQGGRPRALLLHADLLTREHPVMQGEILRLACRAAGSLRDVGRIHIRALLRLFLREAGREIELPRGLRARREGSGIRLYLAGPEQREDRPALPLLPGAAVRAGDCLLEARLEEAVPRRTDEKRYTKTIDYDKIKYTMVVRTRKKGDYLTLREDGARKKLSDYFTDRKLPREIRDRILVVADGSEIVWIPGLRLGYRYRLTGQTARALTLRLTGETDKTRDRMDKEIVMSEIKDKISVMISKERVAARIRELGEQISEDYAGKKIHMICVLKGGVYFMTMLSQSISEDIPVSLDFMSVSSYGDELKSSGIVKIIKDLDEPLEGKDVLVVEDIIDSGRTLHYLLGILKDRKPASLRLCTLLDKPDRRERDVEVAYTGFVIEDRFVIGCGMDYCQYYRNLPFIGVVEE